MKAEPKTRHWTGIGWQGIEFPVPDGWHLARVQGERRKGYLRVDDDERVRMELRWEKPRRRPADFGDVADQMLARLEKFSRKKKSLFTVKRDVRVASPAGKEFECFETRGDVASYGCLMRCTVCGRTILGRVMGRPKEDLKPIAKRVFEALTDHPGEDGLDHWNVYDLKFALPPTYVLQRTRLRTGALEMRFNEKKTELDIRRIGLAAVLLKERTLKSFVINALYKELRGYDYQSAELQVHEHDGIGITGPKTFRSRMLSTTGGKRYVHAYAWVCDGRIYIFRMVCRQREEPLFFELAAHVKCH